MTPSGSPTRLWIRRDVEIDGRTVFRLRFNRRDGGQVPPDAKDGVGDLGTVEVFADALAYAFPRLTDAATFGWRTWGDSQPCEVAIRSLGPSRNGLAVIDGRTAPYMVLSPLGFDTDPDAMRRRRQATVVHELIHLLQFESSLFQCWHQTRIGTDPNWWFHEAVALATECLVYPDRPPSYSRLWQWATQPELSLESDHDGNLAAPFILYLMKRLDSPLIARIYDSTSDDVDALRAVGLIDRELAQLGLTLATDAINQEALFIDYCVDAALLGIDNTVLDSRILDIVGPRATSDVLRSYPIRSGASMPIDHLGCRYFDLLPAATDAAVSLIVEVTPRPENSGSFDRNALRGELVVISKDRSTVSRKTLAAQPEGHLSASVAGFTPESIERVILVLANCAFGSGWAFKDGLQFTVSARVE